ncbi:MAG TPA: class I SAM-dependent methyltransferase [Acetobacteraceae bacterium]|nr:class I SAM-dependent methyltransferase [Acetobacteraceae bacterium]
MSHLQQQLYVRRLSETFPDAFRKRRVLEIGSLDLNGSVRQHFHDCDYIGIDLGPGPGVDVVAEGQNYDAPDGSFDVVISCETMEHNPYWKETMLNMVRMCRPGGLVIMTCATTGRVEHGTRRTTPQDAPLIPWDYYRNLTQRDFKDALPLARLFSLHVFCEERSASDLYFAGFKVGGSVPGNARSALGALKRRYMLQNARSFGSAALARLVGRRP